ncbi:hypothetical protein ACFVT5_18290 [Streptomyces sp. NPDC058001]|uniref:hypothetical protein n=1 Tax=Streptomyces sp. NPDC058001 TaxID=3346300 RepID=UPI0036EB5423
MTPGTVPPVPPRPTLLPVREHSRAVFVGSSACLPQSTSAIRQPEEVTDRLTEVLTSPGPHGALHRQGTTCVRDPERPADVLDALRQAAELASDVLLFFYAGSAFLHGSGLVLGVGETDHRRPAETGVALDTVAEIMSTGRAARPVVILDCDYGDLAAHRFAEAVPGLSLLAAGTSSFRPTVDPFTATLIEGLTGGVQDGPETLDLVTLQNAIEADFTRTRYFVENEYIGGPSSVLARGGRNLALGVNPAFGRNGSGALPPHPDVVHEQEAW